MNRTDDPVLDAAHRLATSLSDSLGSGLATLTVASDLLLLMAAPSQAEFDLVSGTVRETLEDLLEWLNGRFLTNQQTLVLLGMLGLALVSHFQSEELPAEPNAVPVGHA